MARLLVVDDEPSTLHLFRRVFEAEDVTVATATSGEAGLRLFSEAGPDAVVLDVLLPDRTGLEVFREMHRLDPKVPVILITAGGTSDTAIEAMKLGAFDYLLKPLDFGRVRILLRRAFEIRRLMHEPVSVDPDMGKIPAGHDAIVGRGPAMQEVYKAIGRVAPQTVTVLIRGESGTGKELVGRAIYHHSNRADGPFLAVNCAAIPETLLESELFGHEKGSFTGADRRRIGKFEQCSGGTLFLDEIGDMPLVLQSKILRVLQDQQFERVGGNQTIRTDVRIIASTNRDLEQMVAAGTFRSDLYYRLNVYTITLPPLGERPEDLPLLVDHFLVRANRELGKQIRSIAPDAMELLRVYPWPGNVRQLQSVLKQAALRTAGPVLLADFLPDTVRLYHPAESPASPVPGSISIDWDRFLDQRLESGTNQLYDEAVNLLERMVITRVLRHTSGNQLQAAKILGITRSTMRAKMRQFGITLGRVVHDDNGQENGN
ncbi:MAG: sigma-54-dependent Fis family transcriptional regulator [Pirellulales bacterium]|nr:sigma-54-dependent Fis family transcriptional regulator [Pirellulales bacterium]